MKLNKRHLRILKTLGHYGILSHNKLRQKTGINRRTFRKYLYDLVPTFVERKPPKSEWKKGMKVLFELTPEGKRRLALEDTLVEVEKKVSSFFKQMIESSKDTLERDKPLLGATAFLTSHNAPIFGLLHIFPDVKYKALIRYLSPEQSEVGDRVARLIGALLEFFIKEGQREVYAAYIPFKESCFTMSFLSKSQSETMKQAYERALFSRYWHIIYTLNQISENCWLKIWEAFQNPRFLKGEGRVILSNGFRYDPEAKKLQLLTKTEIEDKLRATYS